MPFDTRAMKGSAEVVLRAPGLYVFVCKVHPYMLAAVIVDDVRTAGLDLGEHVTVIDGPTVPTTSDLATRLLRTFFIATNPANWQDFTAPSLVWRVTYPSVTVRLTGGLLVNLAAVLSQRYGISRCRRCSSPRRPVWARSGWTRSSRGPRARRSRARSRT
jgi:hypothetical protein